MELRRSAAGPGPTKLLTPNDDTPPQAKRPGSGGTRERPRSGSPASDSRLKASTDPPTTCDSTTADPRATFVFEGIAENEKIGDFGIMGGGAAGGEIDCYDPSLGAPLGTLLLATSGPLSDVYVLVAEEIYESLPGLGGTEQPLVRADLVFCALDGGGGFFSAGSIAWTASLSHNEYQNNVATLTGNVLKRFREDEPLK